jgi:hypothetical protein
MADASVQLEFVHGIPMVDLPTYRAKPPVGTKYVPKSETVNAELLDEILAFITAHPQTWEQEDWYRVVDQKTGESAYISRVNEYEEVNSCGTSFCFAGHVALHEGFPLPPKQNSGYWQRVVKFEDGHTDVEEASEFATKVLGLTTWQADELFDPTNTLDDLKIMVELLKGGHDTDDMYLVRDYTSENDNPTLEGYLEWNK